jgi:hypothetical protein
MRRLIPIIALVVAGGLPATAIAHQAPTPHLSCGEIDGTFTGFPAGPQTVTLHTAVDGVPQPDRTITAAGPDFNTSSGYTNPDGASHVLTAWFTWTSTDGPGQTQTATSTITDCPPPAPAAGPVNSQSSTSSQQTQSTANSTNPASGNAPATAQGGAPSTAGGVLGTDLSAFVCQSRRIYTFTVRRTLEGSPVVGVSKVLARGSERYGSYKTKTVGGHKRFVVSGDYRGLVVPRGQLRTITTFLKLGSGKTVRTVQFVRLCLSRDGNPNDTPSQDRASR